MKKASVNFEALQAPTTPIPSILVGIDWADKEHAYCLKTPSGKIQQGDFKHSPKAIGEWIQSLLNTYPGLKIDICVESSRGSLINALREFPEVRIYPVNPATLASYRAAFAHGGGKNDPVDARLILKFIEQNRDQMRALEQDSPETRELYALTTQRRHLVEERVALANRIGDLWKQYFPAILELKPARTYSEFVIKIVLKYPTLEQIQTAGKTKLRKLLYGIGTKEKLEERLNLLMQAKPLTTDPVLVRTCARQCQAIARQIDVLNQVIKDYDAEIKKLVVQHRDYVFASSFPGASFNTRARIIASLGDDRNRYENAEALQATTGIAPITTQSGKSRYVNARWACTKFLKQTFHEYAGLSILKCDWAKRYYESQIARGKSKQMARRALAYKWLRIIYRCWKDGVAYNETQYLDRLEKTGSKLATATKK
jgi:transposase